MSGPISPDRKVHRWKYPTSDCDVIDRKKLDLYRDLALKWHELLYGDERHSVWSQLNDMMWQDATWRATNEARRWADEDGPSAAVAPLLAGLLDRGYFAGQVLAISKLIDVSDPKSPKKGVVSLRRLVNEIVENRGLLTREVFVCHDGLPYDWEAVCQAELASLPRADRGAAAVWLPSDGPTAWSFARTRHLHFDQLSNVACNRRSRDDVISESVFTRLMKKIANPVFAHIAELRNKSIAHAADAFSRSHAGSNRQGVKLDEFAQAHRCLLSVAQAISAGLLFGSWHASAVPVAQYNQFEHWEKAFTGETRLKGLREFWNTHCKERDEWMKMGFHEIIPASQEK